ncbi:MAG TPA: BrnT family toxin [Candidatus Dormibacteraeota bacterium]|nr:BrnT family toxin [Candidatus Dormibacteraeota bacterium]HVA11300.1 BrnT family toxin [Candidatus Dormibacteraeota bacterium]
MNILPKTVTFQWDQGNIHKNLLKHNVTTQEAEEIFTQRPFLTSKDLKHSSSAEQRYHGLGQTKKTRKLQVTFTLRGDEIRIISIRDMDRKERKQYEEA